MTAVESVVFLLDVDNTLLDNDALKAEIARRVEALVGADRAARFWDTYEAVRAEQDYVDFPETIRRWETSEADAAMAGRLWSLLEALPFADFVYPHAVDTIEAMRRMGTTVILSDGDQVYQRMKIERSGLESAVGGHVLIYVHKERELPQVFAVYPATHYVSVDDKPRILAALEACCPTQFTTILVLQGKYGVEGEYTPPPDFVVKAIGDLRAFDREQYLSNPGLRRGQGTAAPRG